MTDLVREDGGMNSNNIHELQRVVNEHTQDIADLGSGTGSTRGALLSREFLFTEEADAQTYTQTFTVPAGSVVLDIFGYVLAVENSGTKGWAADTAELTIGDDLQGASAYYAAIDLADDYTMVYDPTDVRFGSGTPYNVATINGIPAGLYGNAGYAVWGNHDAAPGMGVRYPDGGTITMEITTTGTGPFTPAGEFLVKILYFAPDEDIADLGSGTVHRVVTPISSAELLDLTNTPIEVAPAPGTGKAIIGVGFGVSYIFGTTPYTTAGCVGTVNYPANLATQTLEIFNVQSAVFTAAEDAFYVEGTQATGTNVRTIVENQPLQFLLALTFEGGGLVDGDGTAVLTITYTIADLD